MVNSKPMTSSKRVQIVAQENVTGGFKQVRFKNGCFNWQYLENVSMDTEH